MYNMIMNLQMMTLAVQDIINNGKAAAETDGTLADVSTKVDTLGGGLLTIIQKVGIYAACIAVVVFGIRLVLSNSQSRSDHKADAFIKVLGIVLIVCAVSLVVFIETASGTLF